MKRSAHRKRELKLIGWREWVSLPDLGIPHIKAKIDSGARTSSIHAWRIREEERDGALWVRFELHPFQGDSRGKRSCLAQVVDRRSVRSSNGLKEFRYLIKTRIGLGEDAWSMEMTLTNRDEMGFRLLLGRTTVRNRFLIHSGRSFLLSDKKFDRPKKKD